MNKKYVVRLEDEERARLEALVSQGRAAARTIQRAWILLKADVGPAGPGWSDAEIQRAFAVGLVTIYRVRQALVEQGLTAVLSRRPKSRHRHRKLDGEQEAHLIALACSQPPAGRRRWTVRLLATKFVALGSIDRVAPETVRQTLKKRIETPSGEDVVHPTAGQCRVRLADGRRPGAEPMPGERSLMDEFLKTLRDDRLEALIGRVMTVPEGRRVRATEAMADSLCELALLAWEKMRLAGEAGSLLKIEEELQGSIRKGQLEWEVKQPLFRITEYGLTEQAKESYVRMLPGDEVTFWERADALVHSSLEDFAAFASDGQAFQRKLFADDAVRGLAFVDLCRQRFDVVLMNPPFGDGSKLAKSYIEKAYPRTKNDLYAAFVECGLKRLLPNGLLGAITSRTGFFLTSFKKWREEILLDEARPTVFADLGHGVLDTAMVETAAYCLQRTNPLPTQAVRG